MANRNGPAQGAPEISVGAVSRPRLQSRQECRSHKGCPSHARNRRGRDIAFAALVTALTLGYCAVLALRIPVFTSIPGWFWPLRVKPLPLVWLVLPPAAIGGGAVWLARGRRLGLPALMVALVLVGYALQLGFGFAEGRGLDGLRDRITHSGHAGFAATAVEQKDILRVAAEYEKMLATGELPFYPNSTKPPGQLLFYIITERLSRAFAGLMPVWSTPLDRLRTFAGLLFPFLAGLVLVPLAWCARMVLPNQDRARASDARNPPAGTQSSGDRNPVPAGQNPPKGPHPAAGSLKVPPGAECEALLLALFVPSLTLITLHLDQCLYPCLVMLCVGLFLYGMKTAKAWAFVISGMVFYLATYVTFSVLALGPMLVLTALLAPWLEPRTGSKRRPLPLLAKQVGLFTGGFCLLFIAFLLIFNYDPLLRYRNAMALHEQWKLASWTLADALRFGFLNLVEFCVWTGIPVMTLFITDSGRTLAAVFRRRPGKGNALSLGLLTILLYLAFAGRTVGETARLWLFLVPLVVLFAARELPRRPLLMSRAGFLFLLALQLLVILAIKRYQDFW